MNARFFTALPDGKVRCDLCPHHCVIAAGQRGNCGARENRSGVLVALTYGQFTSLALDPIEKKPLYHFYPGAKILSLGAWGCNLHCEFCQNWEISQREVPTQNITPAAVIAAARAQHTQLIAYTYNEPFINFEFVQACCAAAHGAGMKNVLVTNGYYETAPLAELLPQIDALNIDLKAFTNDFYRRRCGGSLAPVLATLKQAQKVCHVEVTTLLIEAENTDAATLRREAAWLAEHCGAAVPVHLAAYFPRYKFAAPATELATLVRAQKIFREKLFFVYLGNVAAPQNTYCPHCGALLLARQAGQIQRGKLNTGGQCAVCATAPSSAAPPRGRIFWG